MTAQVFSDPPINTAKITKRGKDIMIFGKTKWPAGQAEKTLPDGDYTIGIRPHQHCDRRPRQGGAAPSRAACWSPSFPAPKASSTSISAAQTWVSQSHGIHPFEVGRTAKLYVDIDQSLFFGANNEFIA